MQNPQLIQTNLNNNQHQQHINQQGQYNINQNRKNQSPQKQPTNHLKSQAKVTSSVNLLPKQNQSPPEGQNLLKQLQKNIETKKSLQSTNKFKEMLAERPQNHNLESQNINNDTKKEVPQKQLIKSSSKTSTNFHVSKKKNLSSNISPKSSLNIGYKNYTNNQINKSIQQSNIKNAQFNQITVLTLFYKVIEKMRQRGDDMTLQCLINQQKLIYMAITLLQKKTVSLQDLEPIFNLNKQIISFVQKINKVTMENFKQQDQNIDVKIFSKAVDLLMKPQISRYLGSDLKVLGKIKVLTFNNLACIYKKKKKFGIALRSVSFALQIEESLLNQQTNQQKYDIIPTYLNKAAILSEMNKHQNAIQQIMKSQKFIQKIQRQVIKQITQAEQQKNQELKKRLQQKRYYGLYMKMIINYNMGAEKEHMKMKDQACEYYKQGRQLAILINNQFMVKKFEMILNKIMETRKNK